jgi:hypothetical protein
MTAYDIASPEEATDPDGMTEYAAQLRRVPESFEGSR